MFKRSLVFATFTALALSIGMDGAIAAQTDSGDALTGEGTTLLLANKNERMKGELMEKLNLSNSQKQEIQAIKQSYSSQMQSRRESMMEAQKTMQELAQNGNTSTAQLESQRQVLISRRQAFADLKFEQMMKIREVLTVSQRETMAEFMMEKRSENGFFNQRKGFNKVSQDFEDSFI